MINTACGETVQSFHPNATTCVTTGGSSLLLFEHKGISMPNSKKGFCLPRANTDSPERRLFSTSQRQKLYAVLIIPTVSPLDLTIPNSRPSARPHNIKLLEKTMENRAGTFFTSHLPLPFALLALLAQHRPMGFIPNHLMYLYTCTLSKLLPFYKRHNLCLSSSIVWGSDKMLNRNQPINRSNIDRHVRDTSITPALVANAAFATLSAHLQFITLCTFQINCFHVSSHNALLLIRAYLHFQTVCAHHRYALGLRAHQ